MSAKQFHVPGAIAAPVGDGYSHAVSAGGVIYLTLRFTAGRRRLFAVVLPALLQRSGHRRVPRLSQRHGHRAHRYAGLVQSTDPKTCG